MIIIIIIIIPILYLLLLSLLLFLIIIIMIMLVSTLLARPLSLCLENLENYLFGCHDSIGLLILIQLVNAFHLIMQRRRVAVLDSFFDRMTMLLWPRFKQCFDAHINSIKNLHMNPRKLGPFNPRDFSPHYTCYRYAEYTSGKSLSI